MEFREGAFDFQTSQQNQKAFSRIKQPLTEVEIFHTDRGKEFDNQAIDELLTTFDINRSLSHKGCPFDNAVAESTYKSLKVEFVYQYTFETLQQLIWSYLTMSIGGTTSVARYTWLRDTGWLP